jgi:hypothetical protein
MAAHEDGSWRRGAGYKPEHKGAKRILVQLC